MTDTVDTETRSRMMSAVKGKNTAPELIVRRYLHGEGFRFRLHKRTLPGNPDIVLRRYRLVIFVHGCFWHRHADCYYATMPATRPAFWQEKLERNRLRDERQRDELLQSGWRVLTIWECGLKHAMERISELPGLITGAEEVMFWPEEPPRIRLSKTDDTGH